jgi:Carboxypeptidase regulatory-like domain/TonB dependent receptor
MVTIPEIDDSGKRGGTVMSIRKLGVLLAATLILALTPAAVWSQNVYGTMAGTVTDSSGAAVAGTSVTLINLDNNEKHSMAADASGNYTFVNILPGRYRLEAEKSGFKKFVREPIVVQIESGIKVEIILQVGSQTETVEVTGAPPLLQPETNSLGQVVEQRSVTELPLNGRNPLALVALVPGVVPQGSPSGGNASGGNPVGANPFALGDFQVGGGMSGQSQILIDGVPTNGAYLNVVTVIPTQDAIEEFKVQTNNLGPEYGRFAGGVINLSTKSGTNRFHGSAYEFLRNKVFNANDYFDNQRNIARAPLTQNQFGANIGGPILKDKLFFFFSYEGYRLRKGNPFITWVPTDAERGGDFSGLGSSGTASVLTIYDPLTSGTVAGVPTPCDGTHPTCRDAFAGNKIPAGRIDGTAQALLSYFPEPNLAGSTDGNFATSYSSGGSVNQYNARADYALSAKQRIFGRYTQSKIVSLPDSPFNQICTDRCLETTTAKQVSLGDTISLSPTMVLDLHLGYTRYVYLRVPLSQGIDLSKFGPNWAALTPELTYTHIPQVCVSQTPGDDRWGGGWCAQGTGSGIGAHDDTYSFAPVLSKIIGKHTIKAGAEFRVLRNDYYQSNDPAGLFQLNAKMTSANPQLGGNGRTPGADAAAGGNGFASFLLGYGDNGSATEPARTADENLYYAFYAGDTFQLTRKLTLNLGARVDLQGDWTERTDRIVDVNPTEASPLLALSPGLAAAFPNLKGGFDLVHSARHSSRSPFPSWKHVSPRLGVSYQLDQNTVIRTGYGMFYLPVDVRWNDAPHNLFINSFTTPWLTAQSDGVTPKATLFNPFAGGVTPPFGRNQALIDVQGNGNEAASANNPAPYAQQWNLDIQHQFPGNLLLDVAYAGSKGTHLPMHDQTIDQLLPQNLPKNALDVANLTKLVANPFAGNCTGCTGPVQSGGVGTNSTVKAAQLLLPFPQFDNFSLAEPDDRDSSYHSMQLKVVKRFSAGAQVLASYTVSKLIDDTNSEINWLEAAAPSWNDANSYNLRGERSLDGFDVPQRLVIGSIMDLPFGHGKKFAGSATGAADKVIGGWGINTIITFQRGFPIIISGCPGALSNSGIPNVGCSRPTRTALSHLTSGSKQDKLAHWFDTSVFTNGDPTVFNYGTDSRTEPNIRSDGAKNFDFAAFKNTKFGPDGRIGLEFRAEFFNLFNRTQFNPPNTSCCGGSSFGQVTGQYNLPRVVQFALRTTF